MRRRVRKTIPAAVVFALPLFLDVVACEDENVPTQVYDYYLAVEEDVIKPASGTANAWVTIRGVDAGGNPGPGEIYYVSPTGNNSNPGTEDQPWATVAYGASRLQPGDTLVVLAKDRGRRPVLAGKDNLSRGIDLTGVHYVRIENLELTSADGALFRDGIMAMGQPASHIVLKDLYVHHVDEFGMDFGDIDHLTIESCTISHCGYGALGGPAGEHGGWTNVKIKGCHLVYSGHYYQGGPGPSPYERPDGFGIEPSEGPIEIVNTYTAHNRGDGLDSKARNTYIHECIVANNSCDGIKLWGGGSKVENCLVYGRGDGNPEPTPWASVVIGTTENGATFDFANVTVDDEGCVMYAQYDDPNVPIDLDIRNVIFNSRGRDGAIYLAPAVDFTFSHCLFYMPRSDGIVIHGNKYYYPSDVGDLGPGNKYGNPLFVKIGWGEEGDYHVRDGSPAIDGGTANGAPRKDLEGNARPRGAGYDIGAYER